MAKHDPDMTEQEAREEMYRRTHSRRDDRDPYARGEEGWWVAPGYGMGAMAPQMYAAPFMPPMRRNTGYDPHAAPEAADRRYRGHPDDRHQRGFMDKAGDEIASWFGDDAAEARREADHRGRGPKGYVRSDARIEEDVHDRLTDHPRVDASEIEVSVADREVTLNGTVDSRQAKRWAEDCCDSVSGVTHVQNNLRVQSNAL
ncbi:BON domain-containing protein [Marinovum sp.]|uniref:BON domain-containing protein n=1 Tax=Marinovum sp. TaxID=2024839 RepID=UPI002B26BE45|nr:BON domain-containing protein [Marinovum sp.]